MTFYERKNPRMGSWDYRQSAAYFVTFCTRGHRPLLGRIVADASDLSKTGFRPAPLGMACAQAIETVDASRGARIDAWVVMPNHVHLLVAVDGETASGHPGNPVSRLVSTVKAAVTRCARGRGIAGPVWQRSFHDHVVRDEEDRDRILEYIANNPAKWAFDRYFVE